MPPAVGPPQSRRLRHAGAPINGGARHPEGVDLVGQVDAALRVGRLFRIDQQVDVAATQREAAAEGDDAFPGACQAIWGATSRNKLANYLGRVR